MNHLFNTCGSQQNVSQNYLNNLYQSGLSGALVSNHGYLAGQTISVPTHFPNPNELPKTNKTHLKPIDQLRYEINEWHGDILKV